MIRIEKIHIHEFRDIRELTLDLKGQNFAACGPNGTGKSGIVDAIEFALTGNISRLSGSGTGGLSVKAHGPHVDSRNKPEAASVTLDVIIPALGNKKATIHRSVKAAGNPTITPADPDIAAAFGNVNLHPEFVLSRRELIRYVLSEPGQRAKEVQALLRLDDVEKLRVVLQKIANACNKELPGFERAEADAIKNLLTALGAPQLTKKAVLEAVNPRRETLGLPPLADLEATTSLKDGLATAATVGIQGRVPKVQAGADLALLKESLGKSNRKISRIPVRRRRLRPPILKRMLTFWAACLARHCSNRPSNSMMEPLARFVTRPSSLACLRRIWPPSSAILMPSPRNGLLWNPKSSRSSTRCMQQGQPWRP